MVDVVIDAAWHGPSWRRSSSCRCGRKRMFSKAALHRTVLCRMSQFYYFYSIGNLQFSVMLHLCCYKTTLFITSQIESILFTQESNPCPMWHVEPSESLFQRSYIDDHHVLTQVLRDVPWRIPWPVGRPSRGLAGFEMPEGRNSGPRLKIIFLFLTIISIRDSKNLYEIL